MTTTEPDYAQAAADLLTAIVAGYVSFPEHIRPAAATVGSTIVIRLNVAAADYGKIVGSRGVNFAALQAIFKAAAEKIGKKLNLILEDQPRTHCDLPPFRADPEWDQAPLEALLRRGLDAALPTAYTLSSGEVSETTVFEVEPAAPHRLLEILATAFHTLFHAIGKAQGRYLQITFADAKPRPV